MWDRMVGFSPSMMGDPISLIGKDVDPRALPRGQWEIPNYKPEKSGYLWCLYL